MPIKNNLMTVSLLAMLLSGACNAAFAAENGRENGRAAPVSFAADTMQNDEQKKIVTARGNVEMEQAGRTLRADEVVYDVRNDIVHARGNVVLTDPDGNVHHADQLTLTDEMQNGTVDHLRTVAADGSRFWADQGDRHQTPDAPKTTTMKRAAYTPCEACENDPDSTPPWQLSANKVTHKEDEQRVVYHHATLDIWGVPVLYTPYFSHSDGTVEQKSGFLTPGAGYKSDHGLMISNSYYWAIDPYQDATLGVTLMTEQAPLFFGQYRRRFNNASLELEGGVTHSDRTEWQNGMDVYKKDELRGHIFAEGLWDINDQWRGGLNVEYASDDQYMRQYDFSNKDVLENELYVERFSGRDYAVGRVMSFQDIRIGENRADQPHVLPEIQANFLGDAGQLLGGRWSLDFSTLGLQRDADGQDMHRAVAQTGWQRRFVSGLGLLTTVDLLLRGDAYYTTDRDAAPSGSGRSGDGSETRGFAQAHMVTSYPVAKTMKNAQLVIEPIAALTVAPNITSSSSNIPNEDSLDVQLDASNIFEADRFPGMDRIEDKSRVTYGARTGVYGYEGSKAEAFLGQSYRFDQSGNPFPQGSGLSEQSSDLVGQVTARYRDVFSLDYRFQLDSESFASERHEISGTTTMGPLTLGSRYLYAKGIDGTELSTEREQVQGWASYKLTEQWTTHGYIVQDLGDDPGLRRASWGLDFIGQCFNISGTIQRNLTSNSSGESNTEAMLRIGLKNLGEFAISGISLDGLGSSDNDDDDDDIQRSPVNR